MPDNQLVFEITDNGDVKLDTDEVGPKVHAKADKLLDALEELLGGKRVSKPKRKVGKAVRRHKRHA